MNSSEDSSLEIMRRATLVLGAHRSGTSVVSRALLTAGIDLGQHLLDPNHDNPKGFFENAKIVEINDQILKSAGVCWDYLGKPPLIRATDEHLGDLHQRALATVDSEFGNARHIGIKDPRLCLLGRFWSEILAEHGFRVDHILVIRHPEECARSQQHRRSMDPAFHLVGADLDEGIVLWARYLHEALSYLSDKSFAVVGYEQILSNPELSCLALCRALQINAPFSEIERFERDFVDAALHRSTRAENEEGTLQLAQGCSDAYQQLCSLDPTVLHDGIECDSARNILSRVLADPLVPGLVERAFIRARHAAVEANLELVEAKKILAFQEHALAEAQIRNEALLDQIVSVGRQLVEQRKAHEALQVEFQTITDIRSSKINQKG